MRFQRGHLTSEQYQGRRRQDRQDARRHEDGYEGIEIG